MEYDNGNDDARMRSVVQVAERKEKRKTKGGRRRKVRVYISLCVEGKSNCEYMNWGK